MAQLTITVTRSVVISGLPEGLTDTEQQEIASKVANRLQVEDHELEEIAEDLDLSGDWTVVELETNGEPIVVKAREEA